MKKSGRPVGRRPYAAPTPTSTTRDEILLDHLINLADQIGRLAAVLRSAGYELPPDLGTIGPADDETVARLTEESLKRNLNRDAPRYRGPIR
jgi:hypothetical protein